MASLAGKRIGLLTASASRLGGGVFEAVAVQADMIRKLGGDAMVFALADDHAAEDAIRFAPSPVHHARVRSPAQIGFAPQLGRMLAAAELDLLHLHGIWMYPSRAASRWAKATERPYLISPHGMLDPWITGRSRAKKAVAKVAYEHASWRRAAALHALTQREADDIARQSGRTDSLIIANAGPPVSPAVTRMRAPRVVYLGRIHPKKNLLALVEAWRRLNPGDGCELVIAGWGDPVDEADLRAALERGPPSASFIGPVFGAAKQALLDSARFTVLPSLCEGLPMSVIEGWASGAPAIMSRECNMPLAYEQGVAIDCGFDPDSIALAMKQALALDEAAWLTMGRAAQAQASGPYSAGEIAAQWGAAYRRMLDRSHGSR